MVYELELRNAQFQSQLVIPVEYKGIEVVTDLKCDFLYNDTIIVVEIKAVDKIKPISQAQLLTYMKFLEIPKGILINFNVTNIMNEGQQTFVNEYFRGLPE